MSTLLAEPVTSATEGAGAPGGERTLEDLVSGAWEALAAGTAACPVCAGELRARYGATLMPVAGRCGDCGCGLA